MRWLLLVALAVVALLDPARVPIGLAAMDAGTTGGSQIGNGDEGTGYCDANVEESGDCSVNEHAGEEEGFGAHGAAR